jgi:hypothetical protein
LQIISSKQRVGTILFIVARSKGGTTTPTLDNNEQNVSTMAVAFL